MNTSVTRLDACQSLLVSPSNSTVTTWADHGEPCRHAAITRSLRESRNRLRGDQPLRCRRPRRPGSRRLLAGCVIRARHLEAALVVEFNHEVHASPLCLFHGT